MHTGSCLCGAVRFAVKGRPIRMVQCSCRDCQRASGCGHTPNAIFNAADVAVTGETARYASAADSGTVVTRHFCPTCGGRLFLFSEARPSIIVVAAGAFDDSGWFAPQTMLYTKSRTAWDAFDESVPHFEGMPPAKA